MPLKITLHQKPGHVGKQGNCSWLHWDWSLLNWHTFKFGLADCRCEAWNRIFVVKQRIVLQRVQLLTRAVNINELIGVGREIKGRFCNAHYEVYTDFKGPL